MKKIFVVIWTLLLIPSIYLSIPASIAQTDVVNIEVLERLECTHCQDEKAFFSELIRTRNDIRVTYLDIHEEENNAIWKQVTELQNIPKVTPITLIGNTIIQGFDKPETSGANFIRMINNAKNNLPAQFSDFSFRKLVETGGTYNTQKTDGGTCDENSTECTVTPLLVSIPFVGQVDLTNYTLPTLSLVLGFIDGFNPCAMWVLVTFLLVLIQIGDRKRMFQIAGLFIAAEAIMYYLILNVWYTTWDFIGLDNIVTPIVGIIAIGGGLFFLWEWKNSDGTCQVTDAEKRSKTRSRINAIAEAEMTIATILAIIALALSVNIIEFACSIGIPQAFTKIIELNPMTWLYRQFLMFLYILMYMADDFIVFGIALYSINKIGLTTKYAKWCNLIGGLLMLLLGYLLIFHRELLVF